MDLELIKKLCSEKRLRWTDHIFKRLLQRSISMAEIREAILNGEIIEHYPDDYPYPSCLILGCCINRKYLHIVCAVNDDDTELWLITAYVPDKDKWSDDFRRRKEDQA